MTVDRDTLAWVLRILRREANTLRTLNRAEGLAYTAIGIDHATKILRIESEYEERSAR